MKVSIGVSQTSKEIVVEVEDPDSLIDEVEKAFAIGRDLLWVTDTEGRRVGLPLEKIAYVEIGTPEAARRIGFGG